MLILGLESSCDETGAAIIFANKETNKIELLSNSLASSLALHSKTGGIIPENAAREQIKVMIPVIEDSLSQAKVKLDDLDAIAVTYGPGLIGSLLVGVETAKTLSFIYNKPLIPTNHLIGHLYANFLDSNSSDVQLPAIGLIVSGGHTDLVLIKKHGSIKWLGGTRDDAAGEALDKVGRLLGLPYPGGPNIEKAAKNADSKNFKFPSPLIGSADFDFSFSGLKTAVLREVSKNKVTQKLVSEISYSVQKAIIDVLVKKTLNAAQEFGAKSILLGGGVAANQTLSDRFEEEIGKQSLTLGFFVPPKNLCTDNGAMIAAAAYYHNKQQNWKTIDADPGLYFDQA